MKTKKLQNSLKNLQSKVTIDLGEKYLKYKSYNKLALHKGGLLKYIKRLYLYFKVIVAIV
jgi:hypothetical protein